MIDTQAIRSKILDLAMRGLMIEQYSGDGTGHSLIEENYKIINNSGKSIKKRFGKGCKPLKQEDCLFDIPENWCWERFGNLVVNYDSQRKPVTKSERKRLVGQYDYYGATGAIDRVDEYIFDGDYLMIGEDGGNFYVSRDNSFIVRGKFWANNHVHVVQPVVCDITYLKHCLDAYDLPKMGLVYGIGAPKLNQENLNSIPIPVPPLAEQKRIVEKIEQAFSVLDTIDELQAKYANNLTVLKSKLIDLAIQGNLTEQLPEDGTTEELLQEFVAQKKEIEKTGVLKGRKKKTVLPIEHQDIPFELPETWAWIRMDAVAEIFGRIGFRGYTKDDIVEQGQGAISLSPSNITKDGKIVFDKNTYITWEKYAESPEIIVNEEDLLIVKTGSSYGKSAVAKALPEKATINPQLAILKYILCDRYYLHFVLNSTMAKKQYEGFVVGAATPTFSQEDLANFLMPLPPLAEQKRIVEKLDEVLKMIS